MTQADDDYWKEQADTARRTQLTTVRTAAKAWSGVFAGILGLFGTVTFVGGLNGLGDLPADEQNLVRWAIVIAAGALLIATVTSAFASNAMPKVESNLTGDSLRDRSKTLATRSLRLFRVSMGFALAAAIIVTAGSCYILFSEKSSADPKPPTVVAVVDGVAHCGPLEADGARLAVGGQPLSDVTSITVVDACP